MCEKTEPRQRICDQQLKCVGSIKNRSGQYEMLFILISAKKPEINIYKMAKLRQSLSELLIERKVKINILKKSVI